MITIGRDKQFDDIMNRLEGMQNGSICHVHVSVAAPRRGGLSTFLEDLQQYFQEQQRLNLIFQY